MAGEHHVLISPLGRSPGAVSGVYFGLQKRGMQVSEVTTVGTSDQDVWRAAQVWLKPLLAAEPGVTYRPRFIASKELRGGEKDVGPFTARMGLYIQQARDAGHVVHVAVTGGRSGMGALGALAAQLYGADYLWHLWVEPDIERNGTVDRLRPPAARTNVYLNPTERHPPDQSKAWELVALPFVDMTPLHSVIREYVYSGTVSDPDVLSATVPEVDLVAEKSKARHEFLTNIHELLVDHFDQEELRTLCLTLGADYDSLRGEGKAGKARELVLYLNRRLRIPDLLKQVKTERPRVSWPDVLQDTPPEQLQLSHLSVRAGVGRLAQVFPAGLTVEAADSIVELAAAYHGASTDEEQAKVFMELAHILQNAGVYDENVARRMRDLVMRAATPEILRQLIADAKDEDDKGFFRWLSGWLRENEKVFTVPVTVGKFLLDIVTIWIKLQDLP